MWKPTIYRVLLLWFVERTWVTSDCFVPSASVSGSSLVCQIRMFPVSWLMLISQFSHLCQHCGADCCQLVLTVRSVQLEGMMNGWQGVSPALSIKRWFGGFLVCCFVFCHFAIFRQRSFPVLKMMCQSKNDLCSSSSFCVALCMLHINQ